MVMLNAAGLLRTGLSAPGVPVDESPRASTGQLLLAIVMYGVVYGAAMGTFSGVAGDRWQQVIYSASKVPLLLVVTFVISLPSFFVLNTLFGLRADFGRSIGALLATQAVLTIVLASLAPLIIVCYASLTDYSIAVLLNAMMFAIASFAAQGFLRRLYRPLIARNPRHRLLLRGWLVIYAFVGVQMGWVLRPFIGDPTRSPQFFREGAWEGNAYIVILELLRSLLS